MQYMKYTIHTTTEAEELVCYRLRELGIEGLEIDNCVPVEDGDRQGGVFEELQPDLPEDDGSSRISFYLEADADAKALLEQIRQALISMKAYTNIGTGRITTELSDEADWRDNWKQYFSSFSVGNIFIKPTWEEMPAEAEGGVLIEIDPGVSFGTGRHESTQLVIRELQELLCPKDLVLDVGCGSGILSIAAFKLGASRVIGTDIDEDCILSSYENCRRNGLSKEDASFYQGNLIFDAALREHIGTSCYDIVMANILADIIIPMAPVLAQALKPGGRLITSGIIDFKEEEVQKALEAAGLTVLATHAQGEWRSITAEK